MDAQKVMSLRGSQLARVGMKELFLVGLKWEEPQPRKDYIVRVRHLAFLKDTGQKARTSGEIKHLRIVMKMDCERLIFLARDVEKS